MRKITKKIIAICASVLLVLGFVGCSKRDTQVSEKKIGMVVSTLNNPFFVSLKEGSEKKAKELGYELLVLDSQNDPAKERSNIEDLIQGGISVLIVNPTDSDAVINSVQVANQANIPVITVDRQANGGEVVSHIASDNIKGGELAASFIIDELKNKKDIKVVELQGIPGASATRERGQGFHNIIDKKSNLKLVSSQAANFDRAQGLSVMENVTQAQSDFDAVFAHNDEMALGAAKALKTANKKVIVVGFDGDEDARTAIQKGEMSATVAQQPALMGITSIENAVKISNGASIPKKIPVELTLVTK
ncbi:ribose ABC transporter substrate-binding protein RbsB [Clostridium botulinum]|uniref:D-ribose transporter subunit RbsB n=1 Tax=Clostridium botulinum C/D str. DC5 TaxID=1443128 RepID=A0A0A0IIU7_CLOBO|nr:ribose ABC transporter substrate-binding protein RbsB [Clostridium botulinum]KEI01076.1 D-ribose transporter subunit RbsB [Clostridium botulinum C/D str. BKT75002]KEI13445.1 D-ribose transporter subunit RbsB [Clostridium botulinum C/D str. BKT2873]KGM95167.1 D-ribose transporter subunit RbsB [Clostridium botulinum D str. CCUG 7971]KGN00157.1 D-ribose transporter subunit RbsB [Clostridium botulinum C/D str. DC5]KOC50150.1 D-ribose transporter subunit RbsB [Clostridium botulinum]